MNLSIFTIAASGESLDLLRSYLAGGGDPNARDGGRSLLVLAAKGFGAPAVDLFLQFGADPNCVSEISGQTALHAAAWARDHAAIERLLGAGAIVDPIDKYGNTPLAYAAGPHREVSLEVVKRLIEAGANVRSINNYGVSVLQGAKNMWHTELIKLLEANLG